jgi:ribosomal protein L19E
MQHVQDLRQLLANREVEEKNHRKLYEAKKTSFEHLEKLKAVKGFFVSLCFFL